MTITATEFKTNFGKYMKLVETEDIYITKNGKTIGVFSNPDIDPLKAMDGMFEGLEINEERMKEERYVLENL